MTTQLTLTTWPHSWLNIDDMTTQLTEHWRHVPTADWTLMTWPHSWLNIDDVTTQLTEHQRCDHTADWTLMTVCEQLYKEEYQLRKERRKSLRHRHQMLTGIPPWLNPPLGHFPALGPAPYTSPIIGGDYDLNPEFASGEFTFCPHHLGWGWCSAAWASGPACYWYRLDSPVWWQIFSPSHLLVLVQPQSAVASIHIKNPSSWQPEIVWTQENSDPRRHTVATGVAGKLKTVP